MATQTYQARMAGTGLVERPEGDHLAAHVQEAGEPEFVTDASRAGLARNANF